MKNKKIAFVVDGLQVGGAEKFLINNVNYFHRSGFVPVVILLSNVTTLINELNPEIRVKIITRNFKYDLSVSNRIRRFLLSEEIYKVFCINTYTFFLSKFLFLFNKRIQFFLSLHTTIAQTKKSFYLNLLYTRLVSDQDKVLYISNLQREYFRKKYFLKPKQEVLIINGIDIDFFNPYLFSAEVIEECRRQLKLKDSDKLIVNVARLFPEKGHFDAIDALEILHQKQKDKTYLLFVGGGKPEYEKSLQAYTKKKGIGNYILFAGNQTDVRKYYCIADIFTLTSYSVETFSLAALEAMSFGLPCSLTNIGGASEMIIEGTNGYLSKPRSPISIAETWDRLLNENLKGDTIRNLTVSKFSSNRMLKSYLEVVTS